MDRNHLEVKHISFRYAESWTLREISFTVQPAEILGIVGPNGSGKSTLLKLMAGALKPQQGTIQLQGQSISELKRREIARSLAVVPQNTDIPFPFLSSEIVLMGRSPHLGLLQMESAEDRRIVERAMTYTDSLSFADRPLDELSGGERQRVIIARALAQEPSIMLLDEPTAHLDLKHQVGIFELIRRLNREQEITVVVVSHDLNLAGTYCDRLVLLRDGQIYRVGQPSDVITSEDIERVYGVRAIVDHHPISGAPRVTLLEENVPETGK